MLPFLIALPFAFIPFCWAIYTLMKEKDHSDAAIHVILFIATLTHFFLFYYECDMHQTLSYPMEVVQVTVGMALIPLLYVFVTRRLGALYFNDMVILLTICTLGLVTRGVVNYGNEACDMNACDLEPYEMAFYYNATQLAKVSVYSIVMLWQVIFCVYKVFILFGKMKKNMYHFSNNFRKMKWFIIGALVVITISLIPDRDMYRETPASLILYFVSMLGLGIGYYTVAQRYDISILVDENNEPVMLTAPTRFSALAEKFKKLIEEEKIYKQESLHLEDVAAKLATNRTYVAQMMKTEFDTTFSAYINNCRVEEAKRIMENDEGEELMQTIAWECGFSSISNFNKVFKNVTGMTPSEWRKKAP